MNIFTKVMILNVLVSLFTINTTWCAWQTSYTASRATSGWVLQIKNNTSWEKNIHANFYACATDHGYIKPGQTLYTPAGACKLYSIDIDGGPSFRGPFEGPGLSYAMFEIQQGRTDKAPKIVYTGHRPYGSQP